MSDDVYSTYEAKARFSEALRKVRDGRTVTITYHGQPVAELRPLGPERGTEARIARLRDRGILVGGETVAHSLGPVASRPGALQRFLDDRE